MGKQCHNSAVRKSVWPSILTSTLSVACACLVSAVILGGLHHLADLWLSERLHGSRPEHAGWFYLQFSHLIETRSLLDLPRGDNYQGWGARDRASPHLVAAAQCVLLRVGGVPIAFPSGLLPRTAWFTSVALLFLSVYLTLRWAGNSSRMLSCLAAGPDSDTNSWRRFGLLRLLASLARRVTVAAIVITPSIAVFIDIDRTNTRLTESMGYAISPRVVLWYWAFVLGLALLCATFIGIGWMAVWYVQRTRGFQSRCSGCGYLADADRRCPECGGIRRTRPVRWRALLASLAALIATLSAATLVKHATRAILVDVIWGAPSRYLYDSSESRQREARRWLSHAVMQRLYFPAAWFGDLQEREAHAFYMRDSDLILESDRYRVEIAVNDDDTLTIFSHDRADGTIRQTWDGITKDISGSTYYFYPLRFDAGLRRIIAVQPDGVHADEFGLEQHERAIAVRVTPGFGWRVIPTATTRYDGD